MKKLVQIYSDDALAYSTVRQWVRQIKDGRKSIEDKPRAGRPVATCTAENIAFLEEFVTDDPYLRVLEIADIIGNSSGVVHEILHDVLDFRKIIARLIPKILTKEQKKRRESVLKNSSMNMQIVIIEDFMRYLKVMKHG